MPRKSTALAEYGAKEATQSLNMFRDVGETRRAHEISKQRLIQKAGKKGVHVPKTTAERLTKFQTALGKQSRPSRFPRKPTGKLPKGPISLLGTAKPIVKKASKLASKVGGRYLGVADPVRAMTRITRTQQQRKRVKALGTLTGQKYKEM